MGVGSAAALVVGHTIGIGIFLTPAELLAALASPALTFGLWLACGALVFAGALTFAELSARYPRTGGLYVFLREGWGPRVAFLYGWQSLLVMDPGVIAALAVGLSQYLVVLFPGAAGRERWLAVATIWTLASVAAAGIRPSVRLLDATTALKVAAFVAIAAGALFAGRGSLDHFRPFVARRAGAPPLGEGLALGLAAAFYSFGGFWEASRAAGEIRDPARNLPRALAGGVVAVTAIYVGTTAAFVYLVPPERATSAAAFARAAGEALLGSGGPRLFAGVVAVSALASALALVFLGPRVYLAMSRDGAFPAAFAARSARTGAPARATLLLAALASVYALTGSFGQIVAFFLCTTLVFVALAAAALLRIRRRAPDASSFLAPGYPATPAVFVVFLALVVLVVAAARPLPALAGFALVAAGLPAFRFLSLRPRSPALLEEEP